MESKIKEVVGIALLVCVALTGLGLAASPAAAAITTITEVVQTDYGPVTFTGYFEDGVFIGMEDGLTQTSYSIDSCENPDPSDLISPGT